MMKQRYSNLLVAGATAVLCAGLFTGISAATSATTPLQFYACQASNGKISSISTKSHHCGSKTPVSWSAVGPQGVPGTNGTNGTNGSNGKNGAPGAAGPGATFFTLPATFTTTGFTYTVPANVTHVEIIAVGGGGGGGGALGNAVGGGGGQGASETILATVSPGDSLTGSIGAPGATAVSSGQCPATVFAGQAGTDSVVNDGATLLVDAGGGAPGAPATEASCVSNPVDGNGGSGGGLVAPTGTTIVTDASDGGPGATTAWTPGNSDCGSAGGGPSLVAGSGGDGGEIFNGCPDEAAQAGYVEILPY